MGRVMLWHTQFSSHSKMSAPLITRLLFTDCPIFNNSFFIFLSSHKRHHELFIPGSSLQTLLSNEPLERTKWESTRCMISSKSSSSQGRTTGWHQLLPSLSPSPKPHSAHAWVFLRPLQSKKTTLFLSSSNADECSWSVDSWNPSPFHSSIISEQEWKIISHSQC